MDWLELKNNSIKLLIFKRASNFFGGDFDISASLIKNMLIINKCQGP